MAEFSSPGPVVRHEGVRLVTWTGRRPSVSDATLIWVRAMSAMTVFMRDGEVFREGSLSSDMFSFGDVIKRTIGVASETHGAFQSLTSLSRMNPEVIAWVSDIPVVADNSREAWLHNTSPTVKTVRYQTPPEGARLLPPGRLPRSRKEFNALIAVAAVTTEPMVVWRAAASEAENDAALTDFRIAAMHECMARDMEPASAPSI
jgi:hypothetical protein